MIKKLAAAVMTAVVIASGAMAMSLNGAGATFPFPIYSKWMSEYQKETGVRVNYASIGSGGGIRQFTAGVVDFGGTDASMSNDEIEKAGGNVLHVPTVMGAVAVAYRLSGVDKLNLDGETLAAIYLGDIKKWNDDKIQGLNPGVSLPDKNILVARRSDSSGTTDIFTNYLAKVSTAWASRVGAGKSVSWPAGVGGKGNSGVAGVIKNNDGSLGYVELAYAETNHFSTVAIKNKSGVFVTPSTAGVVAAAEKGLSRIPADFRGDILNQKGKNVYPIAGFTWIVVKKDNANNEKAAALKDFLKWALTKGQDYAKDLYYAPLPESLQKKVLNSIEKIG